MAQAPPDSLLIPPPSLTLNGHLLVQTQPSRVALTPTPGHIVIENGRIAHIDLARPSPAADGGGDDFIISPGFVDTHLHLPQFDAIGADGLELLEWLDQVIFPAEIAWNDVDFARAMAKRVGQELLSFGTTALAAYATSSHASTQAAIIELGKLGLCGHVGQVLMDRNAPDKLTVPASLAVSQAASLQSAGRIAPAVTPRFAISCSPELLSLAGRLARKTGWIIQTHLAETIPECKQVRGLFEGSSPLWSGSYTSVYANAGLLTNRSLLGHGIHLSPDELTLVRDAGSLIAHCPTANRFLSAGTMNASQLKQASVGLCLGSDIGAGPDRSMVRVARAMIDAAKQLSPSHPLAMPQLPSAGEAWWRITAENAAALGLVDTGSLTLGACADLLLLRPSKPWKSAPDPLARLLYAWDDRWIRSVFAMGRIVYSGDAAASDMPTR